MPVFLDSDFADWIGRTAERAEPITERLIVQFEAALAGCLAPTGVPLGLNWCLCADAEAPDRLGRDGHPRTGIFLPPLPLPRRMWAGGELCFHGAFRPGDSVMRASTIEQIACKGGKTGPLGFVTLRHRYSVGGRLILDERQDIVYREDPTPGAAAPPLPQVPDLGEPRERLGLTPDPVLLFRFSALTFNGHRIHYDHPYATGVEGYDGLVVHGPLQAVLMLNLAARVLGRTPPLFSYRGLSPLTAGKPISVEAHDGPDGSLDFRVRIEGGPVTMTGRCTR